MKNRVLKIDQMRHLGELGIDTSKAGAFYDLKNGEELDIVKYPERLKKYIDDGYGIGAFTLQDMLEMMPKVILERVLGDMHI